MWYQTSASVTWSFVMHLTEALCVTVELMEVRDGMPWWQEIAGVVIIVRSVCLQRGVSRWLLI